MYKAVSILLEVLSVMLCGYCLQYFYGSFMEARIYDKRKNGLAVMVMYVILRLVIGIALPKDYAGFGIFARMALIVCTISVISLIFYKAAVKMRIFLIVVFVSVSEISVFIAYTVGQIGNMLISLWSWCVEKGYIISADIASVIVNTTVIGTYALILLTFIVLLFFSLKGVVKAFSEKNYDISNTELIFLIVPATTGILICSLLRIILLTVEDGVPKQIYDRYPSLVFLVPVILLLSLLSIVFGVKLFQDMLCRNREKSSRIILEKQVESLQEHMGEMERIYSGIRGMKHDMKNTLSIIMQLAVERDECKEEELQSYLNELNLTMDRLELRFKTGNTVVDTLLNMKYNEMLRMVPDLQMDVEGLQFPEKLFIKSYDIGIILGNALDNALEACIRLKKREPEAEAFIRISSFGKRELMFIKMENSFDGGLVQNKAAELPITDKKDRKSHGIGLSNIKRTAEKYQGTMDFKVKGRVFILSVMMKNEFI